MDHEPMRRVAEFLEAFDVERSGLFEALGHFDDLLGLRVLGHRARDRRFTSTGGTIQRNDHGNLFGNMVRRLGHDMRQQEV